MLVFFQTSTIHDNLSESGADVFFSQVMLEANVDILQIQVMITFTALYAPMHCSKSSTSMSHIIKRRTTTMKGLAFFTGKTLYLLPSDGVRVTGVLRMAWMLQ